VIEKDQQFGRSGVPLYLLYRGKGELVWVERARRTRQV